MKELHFDFEQRSDNHVYFKKIQRDGAKLAQSLPIS